MTQSTFSFFVPNEAFDRETIEERIENLESSNEQLRRKVAYMLAEIELLKRELGEIIAVP